MPPRSHAEAQEERYTEIFERDADDLCEALVRVAELFSQPGGEVYGPIFDRLQTEWSAIESARARMSRAQVDAAALAARLKGGRRPVRAPHAGARG